MGKSKSRGRKTAWKVVFDVAACSICEICVNRCPADALSIRRQGASEEILLDAGLCTGCGGEAVCQALCPEKAVTVSRIPAEELPDGPAVLTAGRMAKCPDCGSSFMPERKLATLLEQRKITSKSVQRFCPACRRNHLLDSYLSVTNRIAGE